MEQLTKFNRKIVERGKIDTSNTQIHILNITVNIDKHIDIQYQLEVANKEAIEPRVLLG